ncbi:hypothetical protein BJY00DRAFT_9256 [Aspergillus carlsbadensis]|nr:hypothetical protein BJY00DRAFT_9256 [Aspergillus carlsbadensis]
MSARKAPQTSKPAQSSSDAWGKWFRSFIPSDPVETKRIASSHNESSSYKVWGTTAQNNKTTIINNYVKGETGMSASEAAAMAGVGAAVVCAGCLLGSYLSSGSGTQADSQGDFQDGDSHKPGEQWDNVPRESSRKHGVDMATAATREAVVIEMPHIRVRAAAVQTQARRRSTQSSSSTAAGTESASVKKLKAEVLDILR